jgi:hypothetical protein
MKQNEMKRSHLLIAIISQPATRIHMILLPRNTTLRGYGQLTPPAVFEHRLWLQIEELEEMLCRG